LFSGIVEEVGKIIAATDDSGGRRLKIAARTVLSDLKLGDSISCNGVCLTACDFGKDWFAVEATHETLRRTKLGALKTGDSLNLERALKVSDRLGGHLVSGHVDAVAKVTSIKKEGFSSVIEFSVPSELEPFFVEKGSVTIDGVSLTVASLRSAGKAGAFISDGSASHESNFSFTVALIPHTLEITTLGELRVSDKVNIEADLIGKYVARLVSQGYAQNINKGGLSLSFLQEHGYT
jgi:riboflavin synthase